MFLHVNSHLSFLRFRRCLFLVGSRGGRGGVEGVLAELGEGVAFRRGIDGEHHALGTVSSLTAVEPKRVGLREY